MLFQGQEFGASSPFHYFADHKEDLASMVREGRAEFLQQFFSLAAHDMQPHLYDPSDPIVFAQSKLDMSERCKHIEMYALHRDLLQLRREEPVFRVQRKRSLDGAVLGPEALVLRFFGERGDDRLLVVNFGLDLHLDPAPEPLLAPPESMHWVVVWSTENPKYGGCGTAPVDTPDNWWIPGHAAVVLAPEKVVESH
jgi:maltooligosyltrehalose trehalohydrolase